MTHRSLFKEVAQRIVESAQSAQSDGAPQVPGAVQSPSGQQAIAPVQMSSSGFGQAGLTSPSDTSPASPR